MISILDSDAVNEKKSSADNLTLPYSTAMRPSKVSTSGPNFISEFSKFISVNMSTKDFKATEKKTTPKKSAPKKESTPRKESTKTKDSTKTPRKKDIDKTCTTIGLNIQVHNSHDSTNAYTPAMPTVNNPQPQPIYEAPNHQHVETYPITHNVIESQTYYNMDPTPNPINQIPNYAEQPMHATMQSAIHQTNGYIINGMNQAAMPNSNVYNYDQNHYVPNNGMHHQQYNGPTMNYNDQNTQLLTHFNVSHANVTNNPAVHNQMMNWRNGNVIMSE